MKMIMVIEKLMGKEVNFLLSETEKLNNVVGMKDAPVNKKLWYTNSVLKDCLLYKWKEIDENHMDEELLNFVNGKYNDSTTYKFREDKCSEDCMTEFNKKFLYFKNGIAVYQETLNDESDEDGFVSFMGIHSISTKGENACISYDELAEMLVRMKRAVDTLPTMLAQNQYALDSICYFLEKTDNVECTYYPVEKFETEYQKLPEEEKEKWTQVGTSSSFFIKIECEEW